MTGDRSLYKRADMVEAGWAVVDPILIGWARGECDLAALHRRQRGPASADELLNARGRRWRPL